MSFDIQLAFSCPHQTIEEAVTLSGDGRTISTRQPIFSSPTRGTILYANDMVIPSGGLYTPASIKSRIAGPFFIPKYENTLIISSTEDHIELTLKTSSFQNRLSIKDLVKEIRKRATSLLVENNNGFLSLTDLATHGSSSIIQVLGKAAPHIGFDLQAGARGKKVFPSWSLNQEETYFFTRGIQFSQTVKSNHSFRLSYFTHPNQCRRCQANEIENDFRFGPNGGLLFVDNENLLYQSCLKILLTDRGSNLFYKGYGTSLRQKVGRKALGAVSSAVSAEVRRALSQIQEYQTMSGKYQKLTLKERLYRILSVETIPSPTDPTTFLIDVVVQSASSQRLQVTVLYSNPSTVSSILQDGKVIARMGSAQLVSNNNTY